MKNMIGFINAVKKAITERENIKEENIIGIAVDTNRNDIFFNIIDSEGNVNNFSHAFEEFHNYDVDCSFEQVYIKLEEYLGKVFTAEDLDAVRFELLQENSSYFVVKVDEDYYKVCD